MCNPKRKQLSDVDEGNCSDVYNNDMLSDFDDEDSSGNINENEVSTLQVSKRKSPTSPKVSLLLKW